MGGLSGVASSQTAAKHNICKSVAWPICRKLALNDAVANKVKAVKP